ncbi:hypothetical protein [Cohnella sp. GCM10027633]|uniref:hypothetical protein n=1 Tax=unclassified Cohnella TaxID=2636738 RepID=UPI00362FDC7F
MKSFYRLFNYEFAAMGRVLLILCAVMFIATWKLVGDEIADYSEHKVNERYEDIYAASGGMTLALFVFAAFSAYFVIRLYSNYWGSKSIYTLLALPMKREALYAARLAAFAVGLTGLVAMQWLCIRFGFDLVSDKTASYGDGRFVMHNGLFLAVIRSAELRLFMPVSAGGIVAAIGMLAAWTTGLMYVVTCERARRYWLIGIAAVAVYMMFRAYRRMTDWAWAYDLTEASLYRNGIILLAFAAFFVWHSIRMYRRGAIA